MDDSESKFSVAKTLQVAAGSPAGPQRESRRPPRCRAAQLEGFQLELELSSCAARAAARVTGGAGADSDDRDGHMCPALNCSRASPDQRPLGAQAALALRVGVASHGQSR